jgi:hypothetical protein
VSNRSHYDVKARILGAIALSGSFAPAGTGAPTASKGAGFTATRTGVGAFLLTFDQPYNHLVAATGNLQLAAAADSVVQFGNYDATAKTLVVRVLTAGVAADVAADANNRIHFDLTFKNSAALP